MSIRHHDGLQIALPLACLADEVERRLRQCFAGLDDDAVHVLLPPQVHTQAVLKLHTGSENQARPSVGSWILYGLGTENQNLPGFVTICPTLAHGGVSNWSSAFLPAWCQGTPIGNASVPSDQARVKFMGNARTPRAVQRRQGRLGRCHWAHAPHFATSSWSRGGISLSGIIIIAGGTENARYPSSGLATQVAEQGGAGVFASAAVLGLLAGETAVSATGDDLRRLMEMFPDG